MSSLSADEFLSLLRHSSRRSVMKTGNSYAVTLEKDLLEAAELSHEDEILVVGPDADLPESLEDQVVCRVCKLLDRDEDDPVGSEVPPLE